MGTVIFIAGYFGNWHGLRVVYWPRHFLFHCIVFQLQAYRYSAQPCQIVTAHTYSMDLKITKFLANPIISETYRESRSNIHTIIFPQFILCPVNAMGAHRPVNLQVCHVRPSNRYIVSHQHLICCFMSNNQNITQSNPFAFSIRLSTTSAPT